jgi:hypothetical protein
VKIVAEQKGIKVLAKLEKIRSNEDKLATLELHTKEFGILHTNLGSDEYQILFEQPQTGVFQSKTDSYCVRRRPEKQYQRGLCNANTNLQLTTSSLTGGTGIWTLDTVQAAFDHKTHTIDEAMWMFKKGTHRSVALANNLSVSLPMQKDKDSHFVWHWLTLIGQCNSKGKLLKCFEPVYETALKGVLNG